MEEWQKWLNEQRAKNTMVVEEIPLRDVQPPWDMQNDGNYRREPPAFFNLEGLKIQAKREVPAWTQPIMKEIGNGAVVLAETSERKYWIAKDSEVVLLSATPEPGNLKEKNHVLLRPTIQASESNLSQAHGGKLPPYAELLEKHSVEWYYLPQDGGRFSEKVNKYGIIRLDSKDEVQIRPESRWFNRYEMRQAFKNGDMTEHLTQVLLLKYL